jgi:DNA polymerase-3 subunit delta
MLEKFVPPAARRFNGERVSARDWNAAQVLERLSIVPMFGDRRIAMVLNVESWPKDQRDLICSYLERPYPRACLVLTAGQKKGVQEIERAVESAGITVELPLPSEREAPTWLQERARMRLKRLNPQGAALLVEHVGVDLFRLEREIEKLCTYVGDREVIDARDVKELVGLQRSFSVFELLRYISRRQSAQAIGALRNLMTAGEPPLGILALLARQFRHLWQIKDALDRKVPEAQIAQTLKLSPGSVKAYAHQAPHFSEQELYAIHRKLRETDLALKRTGISPETILEALVVGLCQT